MSLKKVWHCRMGVWSVVLFLAAFLCVTLLASATLASGDKGQKEKWWKVTPEPEVPSPGYDSILYSEIAPKLREIQKNSNKRIRVKVMGKSAGGRNLFLVTVAAPGDDGRFGHYKRLRRLMIRNPEKALEKIEDFDDFKVPVFINGSIHGDEYPGTDACMRLIEQLAYDNSPEVQAVLDNIILLINVVQNPDGRVLGTRQNANNFDLNRDMITQSQPESRATVEVISEWHPMVFLDLHGFIAPMLIEPCTPPHNPNYEYDLYLNWALNLAYAMSDELIATTPETDVIIPYLDWPDGWDDWPPIYAAMYPMLHGAYGHTLETPSDDEAGVDAHFAVVWGALKYVVENKKAMIKDQIEVYRRGALDLPQVLIPDHLLEQTEWDQYNELTIKDFPEAYVIPAKAPLQKNPVQAAEFIDFLLFNGVQVDKARRPFTVGGQRYPRGTYVVWMDQPKRSLANTLLEDGMDVSGLTEITFYSPPASWSHPLLWGVSRTVVTDDLSIKTIPVSKAAKPRGSMDHGWAYAYAVVPDTFQAFKAINESIASGYPFYRAKAAFEDSGRSFAAGTVVFPAGYHLARKFKKDYAMHVFALGEMPAELAIMEQQKIATYGDEGLSHSLKMMGFSYEDISSEDLNAGKDLSVYDMFIFGNNRWWMYDLTSEGTATIMAFIAGGGDFIGLGNGGNTFADTQSLLDVTIDTVAGNGIANVDLIQGHPLNAGFAADEYAFIYNMVWFTAIGDGIEVAALLDADELLVSGYLPGWKSSPAAGMPIMLFSENADNPDQDMVLMGFDPTFRAHPKQTSKLVGNAIYCGLDRTLSP